MQDTENGHCDGKTCKKRYKHGKAVSSGGIHASDQKKNGRKADTDFNGRRDIDPEFFLDKYRKAHQCNFKNSKYGKTDQRKERAFFPKKISGGGECKGNQQKSRTDHIYDSGRFFTEYFFDHDPFPPLQHTLL